MPFYSDDNLYAVLLQIPLMAGQYWMFMKNILEYENAIVWNVFAILSCTVLLINRRHPMKTLFNICKDTVIISSMNTMLALVHVIVLSVMMPVKDLQNFNLGLRDIQDMVAMNKMVHVFIACISTLVRLTWMITNARVEMHKNPAAEV